MEIQQLYPAVKSWLHYLFIEQPAIGRLYSQTGCRQDQPASVEGADRYASWMLRDRPLPVRQRQAAKKPEIRIQSARVERLDGIELPLVCQPGQSANGGPQPAPGD